MAYININDWKCEQVTEWLKGIEIPTNSSFTLSAFANNFINGHKLLSIRPYELYELGIQKIGHQEIILEAIQHLKDFHFNLDRENLQFLAMQVATISTSLHRKLLKSPDSPLNTDILSDVAMTTSKVKVLIGWLDRYPFKGHTQYTEIRTQMLRLSLELATIAQRDRFANDPIRQITGLTETLSKLSDYIIQDITDPMLLQPSYLDLVTLKKKESELGFYIMPSYQYIHRVTNVKFNSPAHNSGKVEEGDEIVQINYQTVVGWQSKKVLLQLQDLSSTDVILTLKKRPKHTTNYGQCMGLIKLPSKKRSLPYRFDNLPSPRVELFNIPDLLIPATKAIQSEVIEEIDDSSGNESDLLTPTSVENKDKNLLFSLKPRAMLQRRHTICGDDLINFKHIGNMVLWHERKPNQKDIAPPSMRDKSISVSIGFGLEMTQRPTTCIGIGEKLTLDDKRLEKLLANRKKSTKREDCIEENEMIEEDDTTKSGVSKVVRFDSKKLAEYSQDSQYTCNVQDTILESLMPIPYADEEVNSEATKEIFVKKIIVEVEQEKRQFAYNENANNDLIEAINNVVVKREVDKRAKEKNVDLDNLSPPTVEPRQHLRPIPPIPPRKQAIVHHPEDEIISEHKRKDTSFELTIQRHPEEIKMRGDLNEISELVMSTKTKTLTNKKKNSLLAKRRKVTLKSLGVNATIQGHLYRRAKDKSEVAYWVKLYFVLIETALYGFKSKESSRADCVVYLSGFTVSVAKEVHSKPNSFKVYHPKKTFYLAAETETAMTQWMEYIRIATMKGAINLECDIKELYSETECSDDEEINLVPSQSQLQLSSSLPLQQEKSLDTTTSPQSLSLSTSSSSTSKHHHYFDSLKKTFSRSSHDSNSTLSNDNNNNNNNNGKFLGFFTSSKSEKKNSEMIVPTAQFKTYRKAKESNGGLQLGATSMINSNVSDLYLSNAPDNSSFMAKLSSEPTKFVEEIPPPPPPPTPPQSCASPLKSDDLVSLKKSKNSLRKPHNFLHASNPNLLDYNAHATLDYPTAALSTATNTWDHESNGPKMTLEDLMLQQQAEEMKDMYNKRVDQGFEKIEDKSKLSEKKILNVPKASDPHIDKIQKRSLPITPDYAQSFKLNDQAIVYARSKEGLKLRDFGYELISNDDDNQNNNKHVKSNSISVPVVSVESKGSSEGNKLWSSTKRKIVPLSSSVRKKSSGFSWMLTQEDSPTTSCLGSGGSFRSNSSRKASMQDPSISPSSTTKGYFTKLSFSNSNVKEKKLLGSPKLPRLFGKQHSNVSNQSSDNEIFTAITFPKHSTQSQQQQQQPDSKLEKSYSHKLPPTFKPETYSLTSNQPSQLNFLKNTKNE